MSNTDRFKFRFWDAERQLMVYNVYIGQEAIIVPDEINHVNPLKLLDYTAINLRLDSKFVMQCTGLKDKSERLIYEGDIYHWFSDIKSRKNKIVFYNGSFGNSSKISISDSFTPITQERASKMLITGNIYENPEFL